MAYRATVVPVMIASPGDVLEEREVARTVIHDWNYVNAITANVVLMPTGWDTHASPELGARPQELINSRVLKNCDVLVGIFWTKLGSPTGISVSGTVEEIEEHVNAGKPALIYFSSKPVAPQIIDPAQFEALQEFKQKCKSWGLIEAFDNPAEFKEKLYRQLQLCLNNNAYIKAVLETAEAGVEGLTAETVSPTRDIRPDTLSQEAKYLLKLASKDSNGSILKVSAMGGRYIQAAGMALGSGGGREGAKWEGALNELVQWSYVTVRGYKGELYELTHDGWKLADSLPENQ